MSHLAPVPHCHQPGARGRHGEYTEDGQHQVKRENREANMWNVEYIRVCNEMSN